MRQHDVFHVEHCGKLQTGYRGERLSIQAATAAATLTPATTQPTVLHTPPSNKRLNTTTLINGNRMMNRADFT